ncbi:hypothetical protein Q9L58_002268 [Maublancomyces gigas]|uniref:Uncharacterized protein n=1 Tax=Discina gigas TaxID=1032678 RepID=A0ABR3GRY8_9PEZI
MIPHAISVCKTLSERLWSLNEAMFDHLDETDPPPDLFSERIFTGPFGTYSTARRIFGAVLTEEFSARSFLHSTIISDYLSILRDDVCMAMCVLQSIENDNTTDRDHIEAVAARWHSWETVEKRWPFRVPADPSVLRKAELEQICLEMWTALRLVGEAALVLGEAMPGNAPFRITADGYVAENPASISGALHTATGRQVRGAVRARKLIKQD